MADLSGKIALVTGASRGLGYAVAVELAARGVHVIALARTVGGLEDLDDIIAKSPGGCTLTPMDITDDAGLERLGAAIHGRWGKLDLMIHCAAEAAPMSPAEHTAAKDFDKAMAVNARSCQRMIRVVDPLLKAADAAEAIFIEDDGPDRKSTRLNSSHDQISYAVFCLKKKKYTYRKMIGVLSPTGSISIRLSRRPSMQ